MITLQELIIKLQQYWARQGCIVFQPIDKQVGAGTSHPMTFLRSIGPEPISVVYVQPSRRPNDGRYGKNPYRLQHYYQLQIINKPSLKNLQDVYSQSLEFLGINTKTNDISFIEDYWENPTLGAWGSGWEVQLNGVEITQITYFQQVGGLNCKPVTSEVTYGLERLAMHLQKTSNVYDVVWGYSQGKSVKYGDLFEQNEFEQTYYNFQCAKTNVLMNEIQQHEEEVMQLIYNKPALIMPAYEKILKSAHNFNILEARNAISIIERQQLIIKIQNLAKIVAKSYYEQRKSLNFPMCQ